MEIAVMDNKMTARDFMARLACIKHIDLDALDALPAKKMRKAIQSYLKSQKGRVTMDNETAKHTPGDWFVNGPGHIQVDAPIIGIRVNGEPIPGNPVILAKVLSENPADADLFAAAPSLLAIANYALQLSDELGSYLFDKADDTGTPTLYNKVTSLGIEARAAIEKAEGTADAT